MRRSYARLRTTRLELKVLKIGIIHSLSSTNPPIP